METPQSHNSAENIEQKTSDHVVKNAYGLVNAYRLGSMTVGFDESNPNNMLLKWKTRKRAEEIFDHTGVSAVMAKTEEAFAKKGIKGLRAANDPELVKCVTFEASLQNDVLHASSESDLKKAMEKATIITGKSSPVFRSEQAKEVKNFMDGSHLDTKYSVVPLHKPLQEDQRETKNIMKGAYVDPHYGMVSILSKQPGPQPVSVEVQEPARPVEPPKTTGKPEASHDMPAVHHDESHSKTPATAPVIETVTGKDSMKPTVQSAPSRVESSPDRVEKVNEYLKNRSRKALDGLKKYGLKGFEGFKKYGMKGLTSTLEQTARLDWKMRLGVGASAALLTAATGGATTVLPFILSSTFFASSWYKSFIGSYEKEYRKTGKPFTEKEKQNAALLAFVFGTASAAVTTMIFAGIGSKISDMFHGTHPAPSGVSGGSLNTVAAGSHAPPSLDVLSTAGDGPTLNVPETSQNTVLPSSPEIPSAHEVPEILQDIQQNKATMQQIMQDSAKKMENIIKGSSGMYPS